MCLSHFAKDKLEKVTFSLFFFFLRSVNYSHIDHFKQHLPCKCHSISKMARADCGLVQCPAHKSNIRILLVLCKNLLHYHL